MEKQTLTIPEVLTITVNILNGINIPVSMMEQVGQPIRNAVGNIEKCIEVLENVLQNNQEKPEEEAEDEEDGNADTE